MVTIKGLPINKYCRSLVSELCSGAITRQQFKEERRDAFPSTDNLFEYHRAKLRIEALTK